MSKKFPILYHKDKKGQIRVWEVWSDGPVIYTKYGTKDGEMIVSSKEAAPTNVGRANARNAEEQAEFEAGALWTFKKDRKYSETIDGAETPLVLPMLAQKYKKNSFDGAGYIQPKLDGLRMMAFRDDGEIVLMSRSGKTYNVPHIAKILEKDLPENSMFDGELYIHNTPLQTLNSWIRKNQTDTHKIEYHIYDMPIVNGDDSLPFHKRLAALNDIELSDLSLKKVETLPVNSDKEVLDAEKRFVEAGYEGLIFRKKDGAYKFGYRSNDLLKVKSFQDAEFEVVDCVEGVGKFKGHAIFVCKNDLNDKLFNAVPAATMKEREEFFKNKEKYIGKMYTVTYFNRTPDGIPFLPVGKSFRLEADMDSK